MSNGEVFADIAAKYDRLNRILSLGRDQAWRKSAIDRLPQGRLLDLGAGTGAANPAFGEQTVVALDPSPDMLSLNRVGQRVVGLGERLPFADESFDAVFSAYVFRNLDSVDTTLAEIYRVLRPGGKAGIVDLSRPIGTWATHVHRVGTRTIVPLVGRLAGAPAEYRYLNDTLDKLPPPEVMFANGPLRFTDSWRMGPLGFVYGVLLEKR